MQRLFENHIVRESINLDGFWKFAVDKENVGKTEKWYETGITGKNFYVPQVWNTDLELLTYEGACWYEKEFYFNGGTLMVDFGGVMTYAEVYFDGEFMCDHYGGFTSFNFIKNQVEKGLHRITVLVDNSFDENSIPQTNVDWYHYGGIIRSVNAQTLRGISILSNRFNYTLNSNLANCSVVLDLYNAENQIVKDEILVELNGKIVTTISVELAPYEYKTVTSNEFTVDSVKLWSLNSPNLYTVKYLTSTDDLFDRIGFRTIETKNKKIYLNGEELIIKGINRHEENTENGMAFPPALMQRDIDIIKKMNCNSIRGSHYPQSKIFLDMLDEQGITFWSEIPIWGSGFSAQALSNEVVISRGLKMHEEMLKQYYNHPSIIIWGLHNEILSSAKEGYEISKIYYDYVKKEDPSRLVVYATRLPLTDICYEFSDVICVNRYVGWYTNEIEDWDLFCEDLDEYLKSINQSHKAIIMSEFGSASIYGYSTFDDIRWTEEYQARLLSYTIDLFLNKKEYAGTYVWQFANIRTSKPDLNRARCYNNKGVVDEYRRPKMAFYAVKESYAKITDR